MLWSEVGRGGLATNKAKTTQQKNSPESGKKKEPQSASNNSMVPSKEIPKFRVTNGAKALSSKISLGGPFGLQECF